MQTKPLFAALVAAAFAFPLAANAGGGTNKHTGDKTASAQSNGANDGGAEAMFKSLDKDGDGIITKAEAKGTPHEADFASLDKNGDGKLSRDEHANAKEHVAARANTATGSSAAPPTTSSTTSSSSAPSGKTY